MIGAFQAGALISSPWWLAAGVFPVAAYQAKGAASKGNSYVNLANPGTYNLQSTSEPTFDASRGWIFNGTSHFLDTSIVPANQSTTTIIRYANNNSSGGFAIFGFRSTNNLYINPDNSGVIDYVNGTLPAKSVSPSLNSATLAIAGDKTYRNGSVESVTLNGWSGTTGYKIYLGCFYRQSTNLPSNFSPVDIIAFAHFSSILSSAQVLALSTVVASL